MDGMACLAFFQIDFLCKLKTRRVPDHQRNSDTRHGPGQCSSLKKHVKMDEEIVDT